NLILSDSARLARIRVNHGAGARLQQTGTACRNQNVPIIAIETFHQFHYFSPAATVSRCVAERAQEARMGCNRSRMLGRRERLPLATISASLGERSALERGKRSARKMALSSSM